MKPYKEYNRKTKKWETITELVNDLKRHKYCKGKRPHQWEVVLPSRQGTLLPETEEMAKKYYKIMKEFNLKEVSLIKERNEKLTAIGVKPPLSFSFMNRHSWAERCKVCGRMETIYD